MKNLKKFIPIVLVMLLLVATLTGCSLTKTTKDENKTNSAEIISATRGNVTDNVYTSDFTNLKISLPTNWVFSSDEDIAKLMNVSATLLDQEDLAKLTEQTTVYDMVANDPSTGESISVIIEKPLMSVTEQYYLESVKTQLGAVTQISYNLGDISTQKLANQDFSVLEASATANGINLEQKYYTKKSGDYVISIIITTKSQENLATIENYISNVK